MTSTTITLPDLTGARRLKQGGLGSQTADLAETAGWAGFVAFRRRTGPSAATRLRGRSSAVPPIRGRSSATSAPAPPGRCCGGGAARALLRRMRHTTERDRDDQKERNGHGSFVAQQYCSNPSVPECTSFRLHEWSKLGRDRSRLGRVLGQIELSPGQIGPMLAEFGATAKLTEISQNYAFMILRAVALP